MARGHERLVGLVKALVTAFVTWSDEAAPPFRRWRMPVRVGERRFVVMIVEDDDGRDDVAEVDSGVDSE